ncbi:bifunctional diaminohydroxyphosphoribosylaminopyrimidine deaminase/5-amino-6-(5-phosphoribosylamino)uracil reductase RibD [Halothiobacillus sp.]|uniref:bifunctional diaminohydroxyphosphoribosylaminopyrimidine deaminase/5-amino-6-(5-phosphoribosylamino)uracil reductase RibD n=1 Tax=Halothiobacillus sp. TaxID=1891311 RepID=UPI002AD432F7|nr:bifunctional diaminohydroxyphosphoribosylaminopyrimidine deaminase/5-amino-6-(5-phosphoribosylamino)uracil reductase RibD [Halothiobacillus sp.]
MSAEPSLRHLSRIRGVRRVFTVQDRQWMAEALRLAEQGTTTTQPNPRVGCVIVRDGQVVGRGFHARAGEPHAEVMALREAGELAIGGTAYVTLEPCAHVGRTPPCAPQLATAGVTRVVSALTDPDPRVTGAGHGLLESQGIQVDVGLLAEEARWLNRGFLSRIERGRPWVTAKIAQSLDGRTALANGESRWITGVEARRDVQFLRARHGAILTGIDTVLTDDARLNVRLSAEALGIEGPVRQPVRVVLDSGLRLPPFAPIFDAEGDVWLYTRNIQEGIHHEGLSARGATLIAAPHDGAGLDLDFVLQDLADRGINEVLVEAGPKLIGALIDHQRVDELVVYQAPILLGHQAQPSLALEALAQLDQAPRWHILESKSVGADLRITLVPHPPTTQ